MGDMKKVLLAVVIVLARTKATDDEHKNDEDNPAVVDNDYITEEINYPDPQNPLKGRIFWPYPTYEPKCTNDRTDENKKPAANLVKTVAKTLDNPFGVLGNLPLMPNVLGMADDKDEEKSSNPISNLLNKVSKKLEDPFGFLRDKYPLPKGYTKPLDEYDYIIVGVGAAGSVVASRLSEDKSSMVFALEAGKPEMLLSDVPAFVSYLQRTDYTWPYRMEPQPGVCLGSDDQRCYWPRGMAVGGTSVTNFMIYTRGRPQDWDRIAADGNYGWCYDDVLHYYMKSEKSELEMYRNATYRGQDGELIISNVPFKTGLVQSFLEAGRLFGHPTLDYNAPDGFGFGYLQSTTSYGHRFSAAKAFLHPVKKRKNLHILPESRVTKVLIDPKTKKAYGVEYIRNGKKCVVRSRKEVILSAGPIASPQLLMLSGVGPKKHLQTLGIPVISNLKVGRTLYDHIAVPAAIFKLNTPNDSIMEAKVANIPNLIQWLHFGDGPLSTTGSVEAVGYIKTSQSDDPELVPDIELIHLAGSLALDNGTAFRKAWAISDEAYSALAPLHGIDTWSAIPMLLQPKSKGYLELRDTDPFSHPKLYGNYLTHPKDMATMLEALKYVIKIGRSEPFKKYAPQLHLGKYPTCKTQAPGSDAYWECVIRTMVISLHHQIATCKMGPPSDPYAVVDPELKVYGIKGLRVVDSGIIPRPTAAHTNAPAIMIGEKGADMIKKTWADVDC